MACEVGSRSDIQQSVLPARWDIKTRAGALDVLDKVRWQSHHSLKVRAAFADWLFVSRHSVDDRSIQADFDEFMQEWSEMTWSGGDLGAVLDKEAGDLDLSQEHAQDVASDISNALVSSRETQAGRLALCGLRWLATTTGQALGPRTQTIESLISLATLLDRISEACGKLPEHWWDVPASWWSDPSPAWRNDFRKLEAELKAGHLSCFPTRSVGLTVRLARDRAAYARVCAALMEARCSTAQSQSPPSAIRRLRCGV